MFDSIAPLLLIAVPALGAIVVATMSGADAAPARGSAMAAMLIVLVVALRVFIGYDGADSAERLDFDAPWMPSLGIAFHFGIDGFNLYLVLLAALLFPLVLACAWDAPDSRRPLYLALMLAMQSALLGAFVAQNAVMFFVFWEGVLIPASVLILVFGGEQRRQAAVTFFLYTMAGSMLLLIAIITLGAVAWRQTGDWSFEFAVLYGLDLDWGTQALVFVGVMLACLVKCPLVPLHSWLPLAYREAPASVSALMSGALSKMGAYGILKLALPLAPAVAVEWSPAMAVLGATTIVYGAVLALRERDYKTVVAYGSLSHMGFILLGIFTLQQAGIQGAMLQILSHGVTVGVLFVLLGMVQQRCGAAYVDATAMATFAPRLAVMFMLFVLAAISLPTTSGFTAEFMILLGAFSEGVAAWRSDGTSLLLAVALLASTSLVLGAAFMLRFARRILFGKPDDARPFADLRVREALPLLAPLALVLAIGIAPAGIASKVQDVAAELAALRTAIGAPVAPKLSASANRNERSSRVE